MTCVVEKRQTLNWGSMVRNWPDWCQSTWKEVEWSTWASKIESHGVLVYFLLLFQNTWGWVLYKLKGFIYFTILEADSPRSGRSICSASGEGWLRVGQDLQRAVSAPQTQGPPCLTMFYHIGRGSKYILFHFNCFYVTRLLSCFPCWVLDLLGTTSFFFLLSPF